VFSHCGLVNTWLDRNIDSLERRVILVHIDVSVAQLHPEFNELAFAFDEEIMIQFVRRMTQLRRVSTNC